MSIKERLETVTTAATTEEQETALEQFVEPKRGTEQATGDTRRHTDADSMRRHFGIAPWDRSAFDYSVIPDNLSLSWDAPESELSGGTDMLATGKEGSGKSTLANYLAVRDVEINDGKVVWRGSSSRSEWLPLAPWVTLALPAGVDVRVRLESKDPTEPSIALDVDALERIVRSVERYQDPVDLNHNVLQPGTVTVVYPDPQMRGCQEIYELSDERTVDEPTRGELFHPEDPAGHWWFAWVLARVEHGPHHWTTWIADEIGDLIPQSASKDQFGTYQKVELLRDTWVDARKFGLARRLFGHSEEDSHAMIRRKLRWRVQMNGQANPTTASGVVGFREIPMNSDLTSRMNVGKALMYTETHFDTFAWRNMPTGHDYKLLIKVGS